MSAVRICPDLDRECGMERSWCASCPNRAALPAEQAELPPLPPMPVSVIGGGSHNERQMHEYARTYARAVYTMGCGSAVLDYVSLNDTALPTARQAPTEELTFGPIGFGLTDRQVLLETADLLMERNWRGDLAETLRDMARQSPTETPKEPIALPLPSPLYFKALALAHESGRASVSQTQRVFKIGWSDAENLIDLMLQRGDVEYAMTSGLRPARQAPDGERDAHDLATIRDLDRISMQFSADLVQMHINTIKSVDYLQRDSVMNEVMKWRSAWDKNSAERKPINRAEIAQEKAQ